jgi:hypothetical protein
MKILRTLNTQDRIIISSMSITLGGVMIGALLARPYVFGISALIAITLLIVGWCITRDLRLAWLLLFGLVAGVMELLSDWLHVEYLNSLVYTDYFGFRLLASPSYMPIGWWLTVVQFGYLALRLSERWPQWISVILITVLGMSLPPWYEEFAAPAKTWYYTTDRLMLSRTPLWVIFTYGSCMFFIATMVLLCYRTRSWGRAVLGGIFVGSGIMFSGVLWFALLG